MRRGASVTWSGGGLMGRYVEIGASKTWYDEQGEGEPLVLLHGGMSTNATWAAQMPDLSARFRIIAPERRGHGHTPDLDGPLSYDVMSADTIGFVDAVVGGRIWWDGATAASSDSSSPWPAPTWVRKLIVIGTNFDT